MERVWNTVDKSVVNFHLKRSARVSVDVHENGTTFRLGSLRTFVSM